MLVKLRQTADDLSHGVKLRRQFPADPGELPPVFLCPRVIVLPIPPEIVADADQMAAAPRQREQLLRAPRARIFVHRSVRAEHLVGKQGRRAVKEHSCIRRETVKRGGQIARGLERFKSPSLAVAQMVFNAGTILTIHRFHRRPVDQRPAQTAAELLRQMALAAFAAADE